MSSKARPPEGSLNGEARALALLWADLLFQGTGRCWVGEGCPMCQGLGPRALESYSGVQERGKGQERHPLEGGA